MSATRILLVDDHKLVRAGMRRLIEDVPDLEIVAEAGDGESALELVGELQPDIVLMDINLPGISGIEATKRIRGRHPEIRVIVVTMLVEEPYLTRMLKAGATGYLSKDVTGSELLDAIRTVMAGRIYLASGIAGNLAQAKHGQGDGNPFSTLSERETQVMLMLTRGLAARAIGEQLHLSPKTISTYRARLFEKLDVSSNVELTRMAIRYGVIEDGASAE